MISLIPENIDPSEELLALATRYRAAIIAELMVRYRRSIGEQSATSRVGVLLCFLQEFKVYLRSSFNMFISVTFRNSLLQAGMICLPETRD